MDCRVVLEAAIPVYDVGNRDSAVRIAIAKTGDLLNPDLNYVEITPSARSCAHCGDENVPATVIAKEALVALDLEIELYEVESESHAGRIALSEIGQYMVDIPLEVGEIAIVDSEQDADDTANGEQGADGEGTLPDFEDLFE